MATEYKQLLKHPKAHDRAIVGVEFVRESKGCMILFTFAHDSIKIWKALCTDDDFELMELKKISGCFCGIQSYDIAAEGKLLSVMGVESTLCNIALDQAYNTKITDFNAGLMEQCFVRIVADGKNFFTTSFSGSLKLLDENGKTENSASFDKVKLITAVAYAVSGKCFAVANSQGWISIVNSATLLTSFTIEAHACKIRCLEFALEDKHVLSGSDDKMIKQFSLSDSKGELVRNFCGHRGSVMAMSVDRGCGGERFASVGLDNRLILWDINSGDRLHVFENNSTDFYRNVCFSPDGRFVAAGTDEATVYAYKVPQPEGYAEVHGVEEVAEEHNHVDEDVNMSDTENLAEITGLAAELSDSDHSDQNDNDVEQEVPSNGRLSPTPASPLDETINGNEDADHSNVESDYVNQSNMEESITPNHSEEVASQEPMNYQEEFERRELEMQLGID